MPVAALRIDSSEVRLFPANLDEVLTRFAPDIRWKSALSIPEPPFSVEHRRWVTANDRAGNFNGGVPPIAGPIVSAMLELAQPPAFLSMMSGAFATCGFLWCRRTRIETGRRKRGRVRLPMRKMA